MHTSRAEQHGSDQPLGERAATEASDTGQHRLARSGTASPSAEGSRPGPRRPTSGTDGPDQRNDALRERIVELGRRWSRRQHELCRLLARYDRSGDWAFSGAVTCSRWAANALEVETGTAREWLRIGHALAELDQVDAAFEDGRLSFSKVRVLTRVAIDHPDRQDELVALAVACTAAALPWELARWSSSEEDPAERDRRHRAEMGLSVHTEPDGSAVIVARLPPLDAAAAMAAIDAGMQQRVGEERLRLEPSSPTDRGDDPTADATSPHSARRPSLAARRAAAFVGLLASDGPGPVTTELLIHLTGDGATLSDGTPVAGHLVERLAPTAFFRALVHDAERRPINASGRQRHPTTRQQRLVAARDNHTCTAPGCGAQQFLEIDHDPPYEVSRRTVVDELRLLCGAHHRMRHADTRDP